MKKLTSLLFVCFLVASAQAQFKETRKISAHTSITVATGITVEYIRSNKNEVVVETETKEQLNLLLTDVSRETLEIRYKPNSTVRSKKGNTVTVYSNANLEKAKVSSSGQLTLKDPIKASSFKLDVSSSGKLITNEITAAKVDIDVSSSGKLEAKVNAKNLEIDASSSSKTVVSGIADQTSIDMSSSANIDLLNLKIKDLEIDGSSSSKVAFNTAATLSASLSSSAKATYVKMPERIVKNKTSSSGKLQQN